MKGLDYTLLTLVIIGAINWGLIGFFQFDLVAFIFGNMSWLSRIIYALVGHQRTIHDQCLWQNPIQLNFYHVKRCSHITNTFFDTFI